jgi:cytochrome P450
LNENSGEISPIQTSLIASDPPRHRQLRALVSQAFTPRAVAALTSRISCIVHELLDAVAPTGRMDVIRDLAYPLPVIVIAEMLGIPAGERDQFKRWSDAVVTVENNGSARRSTRRPVPAMREMHDYFEQKLAERRRQPQNDLMSHLLQAQIDGAHLTPEEVIGFCILLLIAGNETTTNLIGNAIWCFDEQPTAMELLRSRPELMASAIEEVLRYRSPVKAMLRVTKTDTMIADHTLRAGQSVKAWLGSANRDEARFPDADHFDITRTPNRHIGFGHGIHFCLGAPLARLEAQVALTIMFERLYDIKRVRAVPLEPLNSSILYGVHHLPILFEAT